MAILEGQVQIMTIIIIDHGLSNDEVETRFQEHYFSPLTLALKIKNFQSHKGNFCISKFFFHQKLRAWSLHIQLKFHPSSPIQWAARAIF